MKAPGFYLDEKTLRDIPEDIVQVEKYIQFLESSLAQSLDDRKKVSLLGEQGVYLRTLEKFGLAEQKLNEALTLVLQKNLGVKLEIQQKLRLAHVYQWRKEFSKSDALFSEALEVCQNNTEAKFYLDFALQHAGKNLFDQGLYQEAHDYFTKALKIRQMKKAPADQIQSTELALRATLDRLAKK